MAIRNALLGGSDWVDDEVLYAADLDDTLDVMVNWAKTLTAFWLNPNLRTLYDDFSGYTTDAAVPTTLWTYTSSANSSWKTRASTNAGGSLKEGELLLSGLMSISESASVKAIGLTPNKHKYMKIYSSMSGSDSSAYTTYSYVSFDNFSTSHNINFVSTNQGSASSSCWTIILVIAKGSNEYDCYIGGKLVQTITDASFEIDLMVSVGNVGTASHTAQVFVTDVYESAGTV